MKNFITKKATIKETIKPTDNRKYWSRLNDPRYFIRLYNEAANMVGIAKKKENSVATVLEAPKSTPPIIVAPDLEVPGMNDKHCISPMKKAVLMDRWSIDEVTGSLFFFSMMMIIIPPMKSARATIHGLNNFFSMTLPNNTPKNMAGKTPMIVFCQRRITSLVLLLLLPNGHSFFLK